MKRTVLSGLFIVSQAFAVSTRAAVLAYESFDYTAGASLNGLNATGGGFSAAWSDNSPANDVILGASLTYNGLKSNGNSLEMLNSTDTRNLTTLNISTSGTTTWISFLFSMEATAPGGMAANDGAYLTVRADTTSAAPRFGVYSNASGDKVLGIGSNQNTASFPDALSTVPFLAGTTYLIVASITWNVSTGAAETINMYVNPDLSVGLPATPDATRSDLNIARTVGGEFNRLAMLSLVAGGAGTQWGFDEIRLGDTFADVTPVPEPSAMALAALGASFLAWKGTRRFASGK